MSRPGQPGDWERMVRRPEELCVGCEEPLGTDVDIVSVLVRGEEGFERLDHHAECEVSEDAGAFSFWRWRRTAAPQTARRLDVGFLTEFFKRLADLDDPGDQAGVLWIVGLLLFRKKVLELVGRDLAEGGAEILHLRFKKAERVFALTDPQLDDEALKAIHEDLGRLFDLGPAPVPGKAQPSGSSEEVEPGGGEAEVEPGGGEAEVEPGAGEREG